jgi:hypothetical protein
MSKRFLTPLGLLSATSDPVSASTGDIYFNSSSNVTRVYYGSAWVNLSASSNVTASINAGGITSGTLSVGQYVTGNGVVRAGTNITAQLSPTTWRVSGASQTVGSTTLYSTGLISTPFTVTFSYSLPSNTFRAEIL